MTNQQPLTPEEQNEATARLAAGRIIATRKQPYLTKSLLAMTPIPTPGLNTFAVDKRWRMYYDPQKCLEWTTEEIAAVWLHECNHLIRQHGERFDNLTPTQQNHPQEWNKATDAAINTDLKEDNILLPNPEQRFYATSTNAYKQWKKGLTAEELFTIATKNTEQPNNNQIGTSQDPQNNPTNKNEPQEEDDSESNTGEKEEPKSSAGEGEPSEGGTGEEEGSESGTGEGEPSE